MSRRLLLLPLIAFALSASPALGDEPSPPGTDLYNDASGPFAGQSDAADLVTTSFSGVHDSSSAQQVTVSGQLMDQYQTPVAGVALSVSSGSITQVVSSDGNGLFSTTLPTGMNQGIAVSYGGDDEYAAANYQVSPPSTPPPPPPPPLPPPPPPRPTLGTLRVHGRLVHGQLSEHKRALVRISVSTRRRWRTVAVLETSKRGSFVWRASHRIHGAVRFSILSPRVSIVIHLS